MPADRRSGEVATMKALDARLSPELIDALMDLYCEWREECTGVHEAYARFCDVVSAERTLAYAAYTAALDREGAACQRYAQQIAWVLGEPSRSALR
jgi:hypothetical protein